jgi:peptidyl-prolyl cis-trans isomerase SurA
MAANTSNAATSRSCARISTTCVTGLIMITCFASLAGCRRAPGPDVWATVNGHPIMHSEVVSYYQNRVTGIQQPPTHDEAAMLKLEILQQRIVEEVILQHAKTLNLIASADEVDAKIAQLRAGYGYPEQQFNQRLKAHGLTLDEVRRDTRLNLSVEKVMNQEIESKINITDADIADFYKLHQAEFNLTEPKYHLAQIVVTPSPNRQNSTAGDEEEALKKIEALHNQLETGADFARTAINYSEAPNITSSGGDMGYLPESQLKSDPEVFAAISKLQPGQITPVLPIMQGPSKQPAGYMICKLIAIEPAGQHPLSDPRVQQMIRQQIHDSRSLLLQSAYYEVLRDQARVVNYYAKDILKNAR